MKPIKKIKDFWKNNKTPIIIGLFFFLLSLIPIVHWLTPPKEILIYHSSAQYFDEIETAKLLGNLSNINKISALSGCGQLYLIIYYNLNGMKEGEKFVGGLNGDSLKACPNCTSYSTIFFSENQKEVRDFGIIATLKDNDFSFDNKLGPIFTNPLDKPFPGKAGFKINLDKINDKEGAGNILSWKTSKFNDVQYDCSLEDKQKCRVIKYNVAVLMNKPEVEKALSILKPLNWIDIAFQKELKPYYLDPNTNAFIQEDDKYVYNYIDDGGTCPKNSTSGKIKEVTVTANFSIPLYNITYKIVI